MELHVDPNFRAEVLRRVPFATSWFNSLPDLVSTLCAEWNLTVTGDPTYGKTSLVIPVAREVGTAALKIVSPVASATSETRALELLNHTDSVARLYDSDSRRNALLMELLADKQLGQHADPIEAVTIAGCIAKSIGGEPAPDDVPSLANQAVNWFGQISAQHEMARAAGDAVDEHQFDLAIAAIRELIDDPAETLTHGDLSLDNILRRESGEWVAIDPLLACGTVANEAHTVVRSLLPFVLGEPNPAAVFLQLHNRFCVAADVDPSFAMKLSLARYVASVYWETQNGGAPANVERLRAATNICHELLTAKSSDMR